MVIELKVISFLLSIAILICVVLLVKENKRLLENCKLLGELLVLTRTQRDWIRSGTVVQMVRQTPGDNFAYLDLEGVERL